MLGHRSQLSSQWVLSDVKTNEWLHYEVTLWGLINCHNSSLYHIRDMVPGITNDLQLTFDITYLSISYEKWSEVVN